MNSLAIYYSIENHRLYAKYTKLYKSSTSDQLFKLIKDSNEVTKDLAENIITMCSFAAWHRANWNRGGGFKKNAEDDFKNQNWHYEKIYK